MCGSFFDSRQNSNSGLVHHKTDLWDDPAGKRDSLTRLPISKGLQRPMPPGLGLKPTEEDKANQGIG